MSVSNTTPSAVSSRETTPAISMTNIILIGLMVLQLIAIAYVFWPSSNTTSSGALLLAGITPQSVTDLTITDNSQGTVSFVRVGDTWTVAGTDGYPARPEKINETLTKLLSITTDRLVTQTPTSHDRLQVAADNFQRKVEITSTAASGVQTIFLGSSAGASATHVRASNEDATYLTGDVETWELDTLPTSWMEVAYFKVPKEELTEVTLSNSNGIFTMVPNGVDWTLVGATPDEALAPANISTLLDRIATINLHSVLGKTEKPEYGLETPLATLVITSSVTTTETNAAPAEVKTTTLVIGAKDEANNAYYLKSSDSDYYVRLAAFTGDDLVNKTRQDFMIQPTDTSVAPQSGPLAPAVATPTTVESSQAVSATSEVESTGETSPTTDTIDAQESAATGESGNIVTSTETVSSTELLTPTN